LPEVYLVSFSLPVGDASPTVSNAGVPFEPYREQVPGTDKDYFAIDGWVHYSTPQGHWIWATRDVPLVTFGEPNVLAKATNRPEATSHILAIVFNNLWHTNFVANAMGEMDFNFDLAWQEAHGQQIDAAKIGDTLVIDPILLLNPSGTTDPSYMKNLFLP
jgi:alpha-mannosidase